MFRARASPQTALAWARIGWGFLPGAYLAFFFALPLVFMVVFAFGPGGPRPFSSTLQELWSNPYYRGRIGFTFYQAFVSTILTLAVGIPLAYLFATYRFRGKRLLRAAFTAPFVMPALLVALALQAFAGTGGVLDDLTGIDALSYLGPLGAILLAHVYYNVSLALRIVGGFWERLPDGVRDAARTLGAPRSTVFFRVLLPLGGPAILASSLLVFLFCTTSFGVILLLGEGTKGTLETLIYEEVSSFRARYDVAAVLGVLQIVFTIAALLAYLGLHGRGQAQFSPRLYPPADPLPLWGRLFLPLIGAFLLGPSVSLLVAGLVTDGRVSLNGFALLLNQSYPLGSYDFASALRNSLGFGLLTILVAVPLAFAAGLALRGLRGSRPLWESALLSPLGTSSVLLGLGLLLVYDGNPLWDLRAHPVRILVAHTLVAFPFVTRILGPSFEAVDESLRHAARTLDARPWQVLARVDLPLLRPALAVATVFAFAASLGEFGATLLLRRPEYTTIPLALFDAHGRIGAPFRAQADAMALLLFLVAIAAFWLLERLGRKTRGEFA